jgi:hypothetical protein
VIPAPQIGQSPRLTAKDDDTIALELGHLDVVYERLELASKAWTGDKTIREP